MSNDEELRDRLHKYVTVGTNFTFEGDVDLVEGQRKVARFGPFTIECDEPEAIGGSGTAPQPLHYFLAAIPF